MEYLTIGTIVKTVGLKGEIKIYPTTHFRGLRFKKGNHVFVLDKNNESIAEFDIKSHRINGDCDIILFDGISSINEIEKYVHYSLGVVKDNSILKKNEYFYVDLFNCKVKFDNDKEIGTVIKVEEYNKYATLRVKTNAKDVLIPFVEAFIKSVDIENKLIIINFIEGLI